MSMEMGGQGQPGGDGQSQGVDSYTAANEYTEDTTVSNETIESTGTDENAALISSGASVTLDNDTITRTSEDSKGGDNSSFYGVGAAVLATDGTAYVKDGSVTTDAAGGAGLFAYGDGTVYASGTTVKTTQDTSGGVHVAGGGTLYGWNLDVETNGESSAAIRSDRGGGTMVIDGGNYVSNGVGSPAIYSTADIAVSNASLTANGSEAVCIEGLNSIHLYDCDLTGNMSDLDQNDNTWTVILYQSMSGDSEVGNSTFQMDGGSLTSENGGVFYTTNTESTITLNNVDINYNDEKAAGEALVQACTNMKKEHTDAANIGTFKGFKMKASYSLFDNSFYVKLTRESSVSVEIKKDPVKNIERILTALKKMPGQKAVAEERLEDARQQFAQAKEEVQKPFDKEDELKYVQNRLTKINAELDMEPKTEPKLVKKEELKKCL